jgi:hypothetical protein
MSETESAPEGGENTTFPNIPIPKKTYSPPLSRTRIFESHRTRAAS